MIESSGEREIVIVSACLVGIPSRYDGKVKSNDRCIKDLQKYIWVPCCPEQLGGLPTPRIPADLVKGDGFAVLRGEQQVLCKDGRDVTENFIRGAKIIENIAKVLKVNKVFLKAESPSCAVSGKCGVTAAHLKNCGFELYEY